MGYYKSEGLTWEEGEVPTCHYCGRSAAECDLWDTGISDILCCDQASCTIEHVTTTGDEIEYIEEDDDEDGDDD